MGEINFQDEPKSSSYTSYLKEKTRIPFLSQQKAGSETGYGMLGLKQRTSSHFLGQKQSRLLALSPQKYDKEVKTCIYYQDFKQLALSCREITLRKGMKTQIHERYIPASSAMGQEHTRQSTDTRLHVSGMQPGPDVLGHPWLGARTSLEERIKALHQSWTKKPSSPMVEQSWEFICGFKP